MRIYFFVLSIKKIYEIYNTGQPASDEIPLTSLEESLLSLEKLDRASPELWPEQS